MYDAGDALEVLAASECRLVLSGHKHVPHAWRLEDLFVVNAGTVSTLRTAGQGPALLQRRRGARRPRRRAPRVPVPRARPDPRVLADDARSPQVAGPRRVVALVDGEHYPPVVARAPSRRSAAWWRRCCSAARRSCAARRPRPTTASPRLELAEGDAPAALARLLAGFDAGPRGRPLRRAGRDAAQRGCAWPPWRCTPASPTAPAGCCSSRSGAPPTRCRRSPSPAPASGSARRRSPGTWRGWPATWSRRARW